MESLLRELDAINEEYKAIFEKHNVKAHHYIAITKKPVMLKFNAEADKKFRLPKEAFERINNLIMSYYGL